MCKPVAAAPACVELFGVNDLAARSAGLCALSGSTGSVGGAAHGVVVADSRREARRQLLRCAAREGDAIARAGAGGLVLVELLGRWLCVRVRALH